MARRANIGKLILKNFKENEDQIMASYRNTMADDLGFIPSKSFIFKRYAQSIKAEISDRVEAGLIPKNANKKDWEKAIRTIGLSKTFSVHETQAEKYSQFVMEGIKKHKDIYNKIRRDEKGRFISQDNFSINYGGTETIAGKVWSIYTINGKKIMMADSPEGGESGVKIYE